MPVPALSTYVCRPPGFGTVDTWTMKNIEIYLFDGVEELDAMGPWEVLAYWTQNFAEDGWRVHLVADSPAPVTAAKSAVLTPHRVVGRPDVLIYPGGQGTRKNLQNAKHLAWLRARHEDGALLASVCTGALVLGAAGLLANRPATTYWQALDELRAIDPSIAVEPGARWVDDGEIVTAAGVSAGIDMALHLVVRLAGIERARQVKRGIQYHPEPPV